MLGRREVDRVWHRTFRGWLVRGETHNWSMMERSRRAEDTRTMWIDMFGTVKFSDEGE